MAGSQHSLLIKNVVVFLNKLINNLNYSTYHDRCSNCLLFGNKLKRRKIEINANFQENKNNLKK